MKAHEVNFDGLVGPTHNFAGLSFGNLASMESKSGVSNPKAAALQGIDKMKRVHDLGVKQAVLPPHERPLLEPLRREGITGSDFEAIHHAWKHNAELLVSCFSASSMWVANAATVSPSADTADRKVHITPANLLSQRHRSFESSFTSEVLKRVFSDTSQFTHHAPLESVDSLADEGAANHMRLCVNHSNRGCEVFVYGRDEAGVASGPEHFPARQGRGAADKISQQHMLAPDYVLVIQQNPEVIDKGVFHNDVIAVADRGLLLYHEEAFADSDTAVEIMSSWYRVHCGSTLRCIPVSSAQISVERAVRTYLFNSQILTMPNGDQALMAPEECREDPATHALIEELVQEGVFVSAQYVDLRESMRNGGGPACLRLRVVLMPDELNAVHAGVLFDDELYLNLCSWVEEHYRDELDIDDLRDPELLDESRVALDRLTQILKLGSIYSFQA